MTVEDLYKIITTGLEDRTKLQSNCKYARDHLEKCRKLYERDYKCVLLDNSQGQYCTTYPAEIIVPVREKKAVNGKSKFSTDKFSNILLKGKYARSRNRFPVPVFIVNNKNICRSATISNSAEMYLRKYTDTSFLWANSKSEEPEAELPRVHYSSKSAENNGPDDPPQLEKEISQDQIKVAQDKVAAQEWQIDKMRKIDIQILKLLNIEVICDLMVENRKVKYFMKLTSSEKVDSQNRYNEFKLLSIPYPGCEFFAKYKDNNYDGKGLCFDWTGKEIDAELTIPEQIAEQSAVSDWSMYKSWDLVDLTQNYLKLMLSCIENPEHEGFLVHCISGWDRTPLFVSILRLSLWADGLIHQSLDSEEILYLTLTYDWFLFHHQFCDRISKREEIMHFAFEFLRFIDGPEFSLLKDEDLKTTSNSEGQRTPTQSEYEQIFECENINDFQDYQKVNCSLDVNSNTCGGKPLQSNSYGSKSWSNGSNHVSKNGSDTANGNGHANGNGTKHQTNGSNGISDMSISFQSLPPVSSNGETEFENICSDVSNVCIDNDSSRNDSSTSEDNSKDDTESNHKIPAALSKSCDTRAIKIINMNGNHTDRLASSLDTRMSLKSQPISVPSSTNSRYTKASSAECLLESETNNNEHKSMPRNGRARTNESVSCTSFTGGSLGGYSSSWQMIGSSPSSFCVPPISSSIKKGGREARVRRTSSMASSEPSLLNSTLDSQQSHNGSAPKPTAQVLCDQTASSSGSSDDTASEYQSKLQRRKERLQTVRNQMLSAYLKALNDVCEKRKPGWPFDLMNSLMGRS